MVMFNTAVVGLDRLDKLIPALQSLGARHASYDVTDEHYNTVADALLWTLAQGLGDDFSPAVRDAWVAVYTVIATVMREAAHHAVITAEAQDARKIAVV